MPAFPRGLRPVRGRSHTGLRAGGSGRQLELPMRGSSDAGPVVQESETIISKLETVASEGQSTTSGKTRILAVDDEHSLRAMFRLCLTGPGYECATASSAKAASEVLQQETFDLMLLDILMPVRSGIDYLPEVVALYPEMAVVMMTAVADVDLAVEAMKLGAYDYITKPFDLDDLRTRVIGSLKVPSRSEAVVVDPKRREVYVRGERLEPAMSKKEFDLLSLLDSRRGEAVSREEIAVAVWLDRSDGDVGNQEIDQCVHRVRTRIEEDTSRPEHLVTVRGFGYRLNGRTESEGGRAGDSPTGLLAAQTWARVSRMDQES